MVQRDIAVALYMMVVWAVAFPVEASSIRYSYGTAKMNYQNYTGTRMSVSMPVHEFTIHDSTGEFSAAVSNMSAEYAAREGAIAEEKRKVREGESLGGPKIIEYSWDRTAAQQGDLKEYGLRLGSNQGSLSLDPIMGSNKAEYQAIAEFSLIAAVYGGVIEANDFFAARDDLITGFRLGLFRDIDRSDPNRAADDRKVDSGYFYIPLNYRIGFFLPLGIRVYGEAGIDPITLVRRLAGAELPLDTYWAYSIERRFLDLVNIGFKMEEYSGSMIAWDKYAIKNPDYKQRLMMVYISLSDT